MYGFFGPLPDSKWQSISSIPRTGTPIIIRYHNTVEWKYDIIKYVKEDTYYPWHSIVRDKDRYPEGKFSEWQTFET